MDVDGIELTKEKKSEIYWGEAPADRMKFTITGKGKYADLTYITSVCIDGVSQTQKTTKVKENRLMNILFGKVNGDISSIRQSYPHIVCSSN